MIQCREILYSTSIRPILWIPKLIDTIHKNIKTSVTNNVKSKHAEFYNKTILTNWSTTIIWSCRCCRCDKNYALCLLNNFQLLPNKSRAERRLWSHGLTEKKFSSCRRCKFSASEDISVKKFNFFQRIGILKHECSWLFRKNLRFSLFNIVSEFEKRRHRPNLFYKILFCNL